jgi:hypothetical protein
MANYRLTVIDGSSSRRASPADVAPVFWMSVSL